MDNISFPLSAQDLPTHWYNIQADFPEPMPPPLHPATRRPATLADMAGLFPEALVRQEMTSERFVAIPDEVREVYALWRPTPLLRAVRLERELGTPARIYFKFEGSSPVGSHKPNTAVAQAYYNREAGTKRLATETGAGQWGSSLAMACGLFGLECVVYMVKVSYHHKPYRKMLMHVWGATVHASPSENTAYGRKVLKHDPSCPGSLGIAISEAIEDTLHTPETKYSLGSVLNFVCLHQSVIGEETLKQLALAGEWPDVVYGCAGGGSNFAGLTFPLVREKLRGGRDCRVVAVEPTACPSLTKGELRYDHGDTAGTTPLLMMHTLGHDFIPPSIHAGGLRYHGMAPSISHLVKLGLVEAEAVPQTQVFEAGLLFARTQGIVPAPEAAHAIAAVVAEARRCRESGEKKVLLFNLSGHGMLDLPSFDAYLQHKIKDA